MYTILDGGEFLIESIGRLGIAMDKYKTSELGRALKRVFRGEMTVEESVKLAESEIAEIFKSAPAAPPPVNTGTLGEIVGKCPLCGKNVVRGRYKYGCMGYTEGCKFTVGVQICRRDIPISEARRLLAEGKTAKINGFISKKGKLFGARLKIADGEGVFDFD